MFKESSEPDSKGSVDVGQQMTEDFMGAGVVGTRSGPEESGDKF